MCLIARVRVVQEAAAAAALAQQASSAVSSEPPVVVEPHVAPPKSIASPLTAVRPLWRP
jgi:hypothetical protein